MGAILGPQLPPASTRTVELLAGDLLPATRGQVIGAYWDDALDLNPTEGLVQSYVLDQLNGNFIDQVGQDRGIAGPGGPEQRQILEPASPLLAARDLERASAERQDLSRVLRADEATALYGQKGLTFEQPIREEVARILSQNRSDQLKREDIWSRGPSDALTVGAGLAVAFAGSALDPLNIASAFVPVVGPARFALWAERLGMTGARLARGAVEGGVGALLVEPVVLGTAQARGLDYDAMDSLMNVAFGAVLGGGLHAGGGLLADRLARLHPSTRDAALRAAVAQVTDGRPVDVRALVELDPAWRGEADFRRSLLGSTTLGRGAGDGLAAALARGPERPPPPARAAAAPAAAALDAAAPGGRVALLRDDGRAFVFTDRDAAERALARLNRGRVTARDVAVTALAPGRFALTRPAEVRLAMRGDSPVALRKERAASKTANRLAREAPGFDRMPFRLADDAGGARYGVLEAAPADAAAVRALPEAVVPAGRTAAPPRPPRTAQLTPQAVETIRGAARDNWARRVDEPSPMALQRIAARADAGMAEALAPAAAPSEAAAEVARDLAELDGVLKRLDAQGGLDAAARRALAAEDLAQETRRTADGFRAAAACMLRRAA